MAAQSTANRSPRSSRTDSDDAVLTRALEFAHWARTNIRLIVGSAVVIAVLLAGVIYWRVSAAGRQERASAELMQLERSVNPANPQLAIRDVEQFVRKYEGTPAAEQAKLGLAQLYLQQNQAAKAVTTLQGAEDEIEDSPTGPQAAMLLAAAQNAAGNAKAAIATYLAVAEEAPLEFRRNEALENAAMLRVQTGDFRGAAELYQRLVNATQEGDAQRPLYEMRLAEAQAQASAK